MISFLCSLVRPRTFHRLTYAPLYHALHNMTSLTRVFPNGHREDN